MSGIPHAGLRAALALVSLALATGSCTLLGPLARSEASVRDRVLALTPLGSSIAEVRTTYEERLAADCRWNQLSESRYHPGSPLHESLGARSGLQGCIDSYWSPSAGAATTYVFVEWIFDERGRLVEIAVHEDADAL